MKSFHHSTEGTYYVLIYYARLDQSHFEEVWPWRFITYEAFKRKILKFFERPDLSQAATRQLFETKQGTEETLDDYMSRVEFLVTKFFPKLD